MIARSWYVLLFVAFRRLFEIAYGKLEQEDLDMRCYVPLDISKTKCASFPHHNHTSSLIVR